MKIDKDFLDELAKNITQDDLIYIEGLMSKTASSAIRSKVVAQVPSAEKILEDLSERYFFEQKIEISPNLKVTFRTLTSNSNDRSLKFAIEKTKDVNDYQIFIRTQLRMRLAYGLTSMNGRKLSVELPDTSYFDIMLSGDNVEELLFDVAKSNFERLSIMPSVLTEKIIQFFGAWESIVYEKMNGQDLLELAKK